MGEARRRAAVRHSEDIDTTGVLIDGWQTLPGLAVTAREAARPAVTIHPDRVAHVAALHPLGGKGLVTLMRRVLTKEAGWRWKSTAVAVEDLPTCPDLQLASHASINRFHGLRRADRLREVNAVFADFDYHTREAHKGKSPDEMLALLKDRLAEADVPHPSYWLFSGRGLLAVWLLEALPSGAAPRVRALQRALLGPKVADDGTVTVSGRKHAMTEKEVAHAAKMAALWQGTGLDRAASDVARVFRICGSRNEKSGQRVRLLWPAAWSEVRRYGIDELAEAVLPHTREEIAEIRAERQARHQAVLEAREERAARRAEYDEPVPSVRVPNAGRGRRGFAGSGGGTGQGRRRLDALMAIRDSKWDGVPPEGYRDVWAFHVACAWANMEKEGDVADWARELAPLCGLPERELRVSLRTVHGKMLAFRRGDVAEVEGRPRDPRYTPSHAKVLSDLDLSHADAEAAGVGFMAQAGSVAKPAARSAEYRLREGATPRATTVERRHADGLAAHAMRAAGKTMAEIAAALGRALTSLTRAMAETADRIGRAVETVAEVVEDAFRPRPALAGPGIHDSSRNLVVGAVRGAMPLSRRTEVRISSVFRRPVPAMPMQDVPPMSPVRRFVPVVRPRLTPVSWAPRTDAVLPAAEPVRSSPKPSSAPSRLSALRPALASHDTVEAPAAVSASVMREAVAEPRQATAGKSMAEMVMAAFPQALIVAERPCRQAA